MLKAGSLTFFETHDAQAESVISSEILNRCSDAMLVGKQAERIGFTESCGREIDSGRPKKSRFGWL